MISHERRNTYRDMITRQYLALFSQMANRLRDDDDNDDDDAWMGLIPRSNNHLAQPNIACILFLQ